MKNIHKINKNIYITNNEKIKEGDFIIEKGKPIVKCKTILDSEDLIWESLDIKSSACDGIFNFKKIILTTDPDLIKDGIQTIDDEFLEWFVKNPNCKYVDQRLIWDEEKLTSIYKIIIPERGITITHVGKQETLEEAGVAYAKTVNENHTSHMLGFYSGAKWQQKRMYSEEEIIRFLDWMGTNGYRHYSNGWANMFNKAMEPKQLFEQYKKK